VLFAAPALRAPHSNGGGQPVPSRHTAPSARAKHLDGGEGEKKGVKDEGVREMIVVKENVLAVNTS
jgi:hypothetical protein